MTFQPTHRVTTAPPGATSHDFPLGTRVTYRPDLPVYPGPSGSQAHAYTDEDDHCQWLLDSDVGPLSSRSLEERIRLRILTESPELTGKYGQAWDAAEEEDRDEDDPYVYDPDVSVASVARIAALEAEDSR